MRLYRFFLDAPNADLAAGRIAVLPASESAHALRVLRLRTGDQARVFDGSGREFLAELLDPEAPNKPARVRLLEEVEPAGESPLDLTAALALPKKDALDLVLAKAVELGARRVALFPSDRSVAKLDAKSARSKEERWNAKLIEAAKQCERARAPEIDIFAGMEALAQDLAARDAAVFFLAERREGLPGLASALAVEGDRQPARPVVVVIGPEGGWTEPEMEFAQSAGWTFATLGPRILRAETAAVAAMAVAQSVLGDLDA